MTRVYGIVRAKCGHEGCTEFVRYEAERRADYINLQSRYGNGQWRCVRHSQPDEVLSTSNTKTVHELFTIPSNGTMFWGKEKAWNGFSHGPGFKAFAEDFPEGAMLRVTAEIILPPEAGRAALKEMEE